MREQQTETSMQKLSTLYENYLDEALKVELARKPGEGIFGIGKKPSDDPCHDRFTENLKKLLEDFRAAAPESGEVRDVLRYLYRAPKEHPEPKTAYWLLIAVQSLTKELIPLLSVEDAAVLAKEYTGLYKRWELLPIQKQILDTLKKASGENG